MRYRGIYEDFEEMFVETDTEEEAQTKMKQQLIEKLQADPMPFIVWRDPA